MTKVDFFEVEVKYSGAFDSYSPEDWKKMAQAAAVRTDPYDHTEEVETFEEARRLEDENDFIADNTYPCNKLAHVTWAYIREEEEED